MNVLYIWNEEYGNELFHKKGFKFTSKYLIIYDAEINTISIRKNKEFVRNFWSRNIFDICAIVGENGSGKTVLSRYLIDSIGYLGNTDRTHDYFIIFEDEIKNKINIYITEKYHNMGKGDSNVEIDFLSDRPFEVFKQYKIAYFTNALSRRDYQFKGIKGVRYC